MTDLPNWTVHELSVLSLTANAGHYIGDYQRPTHWIENRLYAERLVIRGLLECVDGVTYFRCTPAGIAYLRLLGRLP